MTQLNENRPLDPIPREEVYRIAGPNDAGCSTAELLAFNTVVTLSAYGDALACRTAFERMREECRVLERLFSRTLPHSDISLLNAARGARTPIDPRTFDLLAQALRYCEQSEGAFDITVGPLVRQWDFRAGIIADARSLAEAAKHVDWRKVSLERDAQGRCFARLLDPEASVDAGGIAKGWIADALARIGEEHGLQGLIVNLGGNVVVSGSKPDGSPWLVGIRDPRNPKQLVGAVPLECGSAVTSGTYERGFTADGVRYHHILSPRTGMPVETDIAGVTVLAKCSIDAEGFSTTLLALGRRQAKALAQRHPEILQVVFVDEDGSCETLR